jgi:di/tricarboxylate transporter
MDISLSSLLTLGILLGVFILLASERIRIDLTAVLVVVLLAAIGILTPTEALSGFSSEPAIVLAANFVLSGALYRTGLSDRLGSWIARLAGRGYTHILAVMMPAVALLSAFTHHVTITAVMLPIVLSLSREQDIPPSRLLMPMSFAASLGTTITIVGAPAFLLADGILRQAGRPGLGIFSIAPIGLALSLVGTLFILLIGRFLLPAHPPGSEAGSRFRLESYYTELLILPDSPLVGQTVEQVEAQNGSDLRVVKWIRRGRPLYRPFGKRLVRSSDVLLVQASAEKMASIEADPGIAFHPVTKAGDEAPVENGNGNGKAVASNGKAVASDGEDAPERLIQAVVAPGSELINHTIGHADLLKKYGVIVVGLWRQKGWLRTELARVRLREGDVLVLLGDTHAFDRVAADRPFLILLPFHGEQQLRHKAPLAGAIVLATLLSVALGLLPIGIGFLAGAAALVLTGCLSMRKAYQSIDLRIYTFIAGAIPLGLAMQKSGAASLIAGWLEKLVRGWQPVWILAALFLGAALITQVMSDAATTAMLAPVAVVLARSLGHPPEAYVVTVAMAAVASFFTPIGHHGNLLIYGPGRYRFSDFVRTGAPLTLLVGLIVVLLAWTLWGS